MTDNPAKTVIKLDIPFSLEGRNISELTMRRPKVEDLRQSRSRAGMTAWSRTWSCWPLVRG